MPTVGCRRVIRNFIHKNVTSARGENFILWTKENRKPVWPNGAIFFHPKEISLN
jgi:hypothetical protein